jgi:lysozyme family protein
MWMTPRCANFLPFVLKWECNWPEDKTGELSNDPRDPGGLTRWGIDQRAHPAVDVRNLTYDDATAIYAQEWNKEGCEALAPRLGEAFYDACVNCGLSRANQFLVASSDWQGFIDAREAFYRRLAAARPALGKFLEGWLNRTADLRKYLATSS